MRKNGEHWRGLLEVSDPNTSPDQREETANRCNRFPKEGHWQSLPIVVICAVAAKERRHANP
jgi:hypothetical protein